LLISFEMDMATNNQTDVTIFLNRKIYFAFNFLGGGANFVANMIEKEKGKKN
jgi:hypothetical protein